MKTKVISIMFIWTVGLFFSVYWNVQSTLSNQERLTFLAARTLFDQMVITRQWNSSHNGVYVKVTENLKPNIYLKDPMRDIECQGISLTKLNPAYMTRQLSELAREKLGFQFHVTGLNPLRPANCPDPWERAALENFSTRGTLEKGSFILDEDGRHFRYMKGLTAEASCLECHREKGARLNDLLGGISIKIFDPPQAVLHPIILGHLVIWAAGLVIILIAGINLVRAYDTIYRQSILDALTGIPNRRYFDERIRMESRRSRRQRTPLTVIMADIDNFKAYNDFYGHARGDKVLTAVAGTVKGTLKRPVDVCARYGGEEFIILLPDTDADGASHVAQIILDNVGALAIPHEKSDSGSYISLSLGIACEAGVKDHEKLIRNADSALYRAKSGGKNRYTVYGKDGDQGDA